MLGKNGSVVLFVRGLPESTTHNDIKSLFERLSSPRWQVRLTGVGGVCSCDIVQITNRKSESVEYHAMVEIQPAKLALRAIRELNGSLVHGHRIEVHRYHHRSPNRDRRRDEPELWSKPQGSESDENRRTVERRREYLQIDLVNQSSNRLLPTLSRMFQSHRIAKTYGT